MRYAHPVTSLSPGPTPTNGPATCQNHNLLCPSRRRATRHHKM